MALDFVGNLISGKRDRSSDYDELAKEAHPELFPLSRVATHLIRMPLDKFANTGGGFFELDRQQRTFGIRKDYRDYWRNSDFQTLVSDRVEFGLARYFYRKDKDSLRG